MMSERVDTVPPLGDETPGVRILWAIAIVGAFVVLQARAGAIIGLVVGVTGAIRGMDADELVSLLTGDGAGSLYLVAGIEFATLLAALVYALGIGIGSVGLRFEGLGRSLRLLAPLAVVMLTLLWLDPSVSLARLATSPLLAPALLLSLLVGLTEELVFRGLVIGALGGTRLPDLAILISSVLFGAVHVFGPDGSLRDQWLFIAVTITFQAGIPFAVVYLRSGSILGIALVHAAWDAAIIGSVGLDPAPGGVPGVVDWLVPIACGAGYLAWFTVTAPTVQQWWRDLRRERSDVDWDAIAEDCAHPLVMAQLQRLDALTAREA